MMFYQRGRQGRDIAYFVLRIYKVLGRGKQNGRAGEQRAEREGEEQGIQFAILSLLLVYCPGCTL